MKRSILMILALLVGIALSSCGQLPNMRTLLAYQKEGAAFDVTIHDGDAYSARIILGKTTRVELGSDAFRTLAYAFGNEGASLSNGELTAAVPNAELLKAYRWASLFSLSCDDTWQIKKERFGGSDTYVCKSGDITLYIDMQHTPLKILCGDTVIDILRSE